MEFICKKGQRLERVLSTPLGHANKILEMFVIVVFYTIIFLSLKQYIWFFLPSALETNINLQYCLQDLIHC